MFIGHFAVGLSAKSIRPSMSLGIYFLAAQFLDLLWPTLLLLNLEHVAIDPGNTKMTPLNFLNYPISHSLVMALLWSVAALLIVYLLKKDSLTGLLIAFCVFSHWLLDFITHRPDLPIAFGESAKVGLGMWNNVTLTVVIESLLFFTAAYFYIRTTVAKDKIGVYGFWSLIIFLLIIHISNILGPPPPNVEMIALAGHLQWLFVFWAYWADKHRESQLIRVKVTG